MMTQFWLCVVPKATIQKLEAYESIPETSGKVQLDGQLPNAICFLNLKDK